MNGHWSLSEKRLKVVRSKSLSNILRASAALYEQSGCALGVRLCVLYSVCLCLSFSPGQMGRPGRGTSEICLFCSSPSEPGRDIFKLLETPGTSFEAFQTLVRNTLDSEQAIAAVYWKIDGPVDGAKHDNDILRTYFVVIGCFRIREKFEVVQRNRKSCEPLCDSKTTLEKKLEEAKKRLLESYNYREESLSEWTSAGFGGLQTELMDFKHHVTVQDVKFMKVSTTGEGSIYQPMGGYPLKGKDIRLGIDNTKANEFLNSQNFRSFNDNLKLAQGQALAALYTYKGLDSTNPNFLHLDLALFVAGGKEDNVVTVSLRKLVFFKLDINNIKDVERRSIHDFVADYDAKGAWGHSVQLELPDNQAEQLRSVALELEGELTSTAEKPEAFQFKFATIICSPTEIPTWKAPGSPAPVPAAPDPAQPRNAVRTQGRYFSFQRVYFNASIQLWYTTNSNVELCKCV